MEGGGGGGGGGEIRVGISAASFSKISICESDKLQINSVCCLIIQLKIKPFIFKWKGSKNGCCRNMIPFSVIQNILKFK